MAGYTKLFSSILDSTIWREPDHVRLVWITMLAMADKNSVVEASIPGLADRARVSLDECLDALDRLKGEDKFSRSKENDGRRIEELDGGWFLLNHGKYRDLVTLQEKRAQDAERARRYRQRKKQENRDDRDESREITPPSSSSSSSSKKEKGEGETPKKPSGKPEKRRVALDEYWEPSNSHREKATRLGVDVEWETEKFRDHFHANGKKMLSWDKAFSGWLSRSYEFANGKPAAAPKSKPKPTPEEAANLKAMNEYVYK